MGCVLLKYSISIFAVHSATSTSLCNGLMSFLFNWGGGMTLSINWNLQNLEKKLRFYKPFDLRIPFSRRLHSKAFYLHCNKRALFLDKERKQWWVPWRASSYLMLYISIVWPRNRSLSIKLNWWPPLSLNWFLSGLLIFRPSLTNKKWQCIQGTQCLCSLFYSNPTSKHFSYLHICSEKIMD